VRDQRQPRLGDLYSSPSLLTVEAHTTPGTSPPSLPTVEALFISTHSLQRVSSAKQTALACRIVPKRRTAAYLCWSSVAPPVPSACLNWLSAGFCWHVSPLATGTSRYVVVSLPTWRCASSQPGHPYPSSFSACTCWEQPHLNPSSGHVGTRTQDLLHSSSGDLFYAAWGQLRPPPRHAARPASPPAVVSGSSSTPELYSFLARLGFLPQQLRQHADQHAPAWPLLGIPSFFST